MNELNPVLKLPPLPAPNESLPILFDLRGQKALSTRQLFRIVKDIFAIAYEQYRQVDPQKAAALRNASPHWIRHATASALAQQAMNMEELRAVQEHMRHSDLKTTLAYTHVDEKKATEVAERLKRRGSVSRDAIHNSRKPHLTTSPDDTK